MMAEQFYKFLYLRGMRNKYVSSDNPSSDPLDRCFLTADANKEKKGCKNPTQKTHNGRCKKKKNFMKKETKNLIICSLAHGPTFHQI